MKIRAYRLYLSNAVHWVYGACLIAAAFVLLTSCAGDEEDDFDVPKTVDSAAVSVVSLQQPEREIHYSLQVQPVELGNQALLTMTFLRGQVPTELANQFEGTLLVGLEGEVQSIPYFAVVKRVDTANGVLEVMLTTENSGVFYQTVGEYLNLGNVAWVQVNGMSMLSTRRFDSIFAAEMMYQAFRNRLALTAVIVQATSSCPFSDRHMVSKSRFVELPVGQSMTSGEIDQTFTNVLIDLLEGDIHPLIDEHAPCQISPSYGAELVAMKADICKLESYVSSVYPNVKLWHFFCGTFVEATHEVQP